MLNRRAFLASMGAGLAGLALPGGLGTAIGQTTSRQGGGAAAAAGEQMIAGIPLSKLLATYRFDLYEDFLPFMHEYVVDHKFGGFMCNTDRDGTQVNTDKHIWYEGRGAWVYAFLYNHLDKDPAHLEVARKSLDFVMQHDPGEDDLWPQRYTREGKVLEDLDPPGDRVYGDLFVAEGLAEYATAIGDEAQWQKAKAILMKALRFYDHPEYYPRGGQSYLDDTYPLLPGGRILGNWMVFLRAATQMLRTHPGDQELETLAHRCTEALLEHHLHPKFRLFNEVINHDLSRNEAYAQFAYLGHSIEVIWMILDEALRREDQAMFDRTAALLERHIEVAWDDVYGGAFRGLRHVDNAEWMVDNKAVWQLEETLIGTLMVIEQTDAPWAHEWFGRTYQHIRDNLVLRKHGFALWELFTDREGTFNRHSSRIGNYHHPRHLMLNILILERMAARG